MILFLLLLILAAIGVGVYASENTGSHSVTFLQWHWSAVSDWVPVVVTAAIIGGLFLLYMIYSGLVHGVRLGSMRRRVTTREQAINDMRGENQRLREENARLRANERVTTTPATAAAERRGTNPNVDSGTVANDRVVDREPVGARSAADVRSTADARTAEPYRARPTFGERVRAFFSGRQPAGY